MLLGWFTTLFLHVQLFIARPWNVEDRRQVHAQRLADTVLKRYPLIDLHVDLPVIYRFIYRNDVSHNPYNGTLAGHVDLTRLQKGHSGGLVSVAFAVCPTSPNGGESIDEANAILLQPNNVVRDTLEQIDVTHQLVKQNANAISLVTSAKDIKQSHRHGKIGHLIGIEGAHSLGNSLSTLRTFYTLGVRYLTLTHTCHNAFADTAGSTGGQAAEPLHGGLSSFGKRLVSEMNRIGMIVDVSHTSDETARQAILHSIAPVIFSHSGARSINAHVRNVPDEILQLISEQSGRDAIVGIPFLPDFIDSNLPTVQLVADHVEHIARIAGKSRVAIGTDFDGFPGKPIKGLEDVRRYRNLLIELAIRGWKQNELAALISENFLRIFHKVEQVSQHVQQDTKADTVAWDARRDFDV